MDTSNMTLEILKIKSKEYAERSEADFRLKGGNLSSPNALYKTIHQSIKNQWNQYPPSWFMVIQWTPAPKDFTTTKDHARHFRNKFLSAVYKCHLNQLPPPKDRIKLIWFHERAQDPNGNLIWHSNLHLGALPSPYSQSRIQLNWIIHNNVARRFRCFKNLNGKQDPALVIKEWNYDHHALYNLKDYHRFKHHQDSDLVLDYENSDLIFNIKTK
jgi:hypothetical protein